MIEQPKPGDPVSDRGRPAARVPRHGRMMIWPALLCAALAPAAMSAAAAATARLQAPERVQMTAWISIAIVGATGFISTAAAISPRLGRRRKS